MILCQNRESSLKFTRIPFFIKAYSYFFKSKWGFSFNLVQDQANGPRIKSSTLNYSFNMETSKHGSRSGFIAPLDHVRNPTVCVHVRLMASACGADGQCMWCCMGWCYRVCLCWWCRGRGLLMCHACSADEGCASVQLGCV